jgi:RNA polymerase sigma-70 factor, ECF subfamily
MCQTDESCVRQCLDGRPDVYHLLVQRYQQPLLGYLRGRLGCEEAALEASQEAFVRAYFALPKLRKPESFFSWLLGIVHRVAKETHRAKQRTRSIDSLPSEPAELPPEDAASDGRLTEAVSRLPDVYRQVVLLRYYAGLSCAEISRDLGTPLGTVTKRLSRAYSLLRAAIRAREQSESVEAHP